MLPSRSRPPSPLTLSFPRLRSPVPAHVVSSPPPQRPHVVVQHQKLLVQNHPLALATELREEVAQAPAAGHVETKGLGEVFLWMLGGVGGHMVAGSDRDAPVLEVHPA